MLSRWVGVLTFTLCLQAQQHSTTRSNPFDRPADVAQGAQYFRSQCAACHGPNGSGGAAGPALNTGSFRRGDSDEQLFQIIGKGIPGTTMPGYRGSGDQVWKLVAYVRSISVGAAAEKAGGDPSKGRELFVSSRCGNCHAAAGEGGGSGPDLTNIGSRRSLAHLRTSLTDPNAEVAPEYWRLRARTRAGQAISGIRLNEDTFSFQYRDRAGLKAVLKKDLAEHELVRTSPMPAYAAKLTDTELQDLTAYLATLREGGRR